MTARIAAPIEAPAAARATPRARARRPAAAGFLRQRLRRGTLVLAGAAAMATGLSSLAAAAESPEHFRFDPVHTRVLVAVEHAGLSQALGTLSGATGTLDFDPEDWASARLDVSLPIAALDFGDEAWNRAVLGPRLLDAERHPTARFVSSEIRPQSERSALACGRLRLRGVERPLCLEVHFNSLRRHPLPPFRRTAGFSATAVLSRSEFGIRAWPGVIGDRVELRIEAEAVRARAPAPTPERPDPTQEEAPVPIEPATSGAEPPP